MSTTRGHEIPTIDVVLVTITKGSSQDEIALDTASKIQANIQSETQDAIKLIVKGRLIAQKREKVVITGNTIVLTDNVFNPEMVKILQGGTVKYWTSSAKTAEGDTDTGNGVSSYTPPVVGSNTEVDAFTLHAYSAIYNAAGLITGYEEITYPNCKGVPIALNSEDNVFRAPEYTINSAPDNGQAPYVINYVSALPTVS